MGHYSVTTTVRRSATASTRRLLKTLLVSVVVIVSTTIAPAAESDNGQPQATAVNLSEERFTPAALPLSSEASVDGAKAQKLTQHARQAVAREIGPMTVSPQEAAVVPSSLKRAAMTPVLPEFAGQTSDSGLRAACTVVNMQGGIAGGYLGWSAPGGVLKVYVDPAATSPGCGNPNPYPFLIQSIDIPRFADASIFGLPGEGLGTLEFSVDVECPVTGGDPCSMPGAELFRSSNITLVANDSGFYSFNIPVNLCVEGPFFVSIHWESWTGNPARVPTPLWDAVARPLCQQWVSANGGLSWTDFTNFFTGGDTGWVEININGNTNDACDPAGNCGGNIAECGNDTREGSEECDGIDDAACPGECQGDCTCPPTGACCVGDACVDTVTYLVCSNGYGGVWHEGGDCIDYPCTLPACDLMVFDNGSADGASGNRPSGGWDDTGIIDDLTVPQGDGTEFTCIRVEMLDNTGLAAFQTARVEIYALPVGGIANLGAYGTETPIFDRTYSVVSDTLSLTDSGINVLGYDLIYIDCYSTPFDLGAGTYGMLVTFPGTGAVDYWATSSPAVPGDNGHLWGIQSTFPFALDSTVAFQLRGDLPPGACCDDTTSICTNGVLSVDCPAPSRFAPGLTCAELSPPCGTPVGPCCYDDGSCADTAELDCVGQWLGSGADCSECPPAGACCVADSCVDTITEAACSNGYGGVWHEVGTCPGFLCEPPDCNTTVFDNGAADGVGGSRPGTGWSNTGIIDDLLLPQNDLTEFTCLRFEMLDNTAAGLTTARVEIYSLPPGGISDLGLYGTEVPVYDQTYQVTDGTLVIADSGLDYQGYNLMYYNCYGMPTDLGAGNFGVLVTFPGAASAAEAYWASSSPPVPAENGFFWGVNDPLPALASTTFAFNFKVELLPGACCDPDSGICSNGVIFDDCRPPLSFSSDTLCAELDPPCSIIGACCNQDTGACTNGVAEGDCSGLSSFYGATTCEELTIPCGYGACCIRDGCTVILKSDCEAVGGTWLGGGVDCDTNACVGISTNGVCCLAGNACAASTDMAGCRAAGGTFHGYAATCADSDTNGVPDMCEYDCNTNGVLDTLDTGRGNTRDCNLNGVPDDCELKSGASRDCNTNGFPDECDANNWDTEFACFTGPNGGLPSGCECLDVDGDGDVDLYDHAAYQREYRFFGNVYMSNGTGGGDWFDPATWNQNRVPASTSDYDIVQILAGDTITQSLPMPKTLARYALDPGATHIFEGTADVAALMLLAYGQFVTTNGTDLGEMPPGSEPGLGPGIVVIRNTVAVNVVSGVDLDYQYDANYCDLVDSAPAPFDNLGPCVPPVAPVAQSDGGLRWTHDTTHRALNEVIIDNNQCIAHDFLVEQLLLPDGLDTTATGDAETAQDATAGTQTYAAWLIDGGELEDNPARRALRHFLVPASNAPMALNYDTNLEWAWDGWGFDVGGANDWDWLSVREYYFQALSEPSATAREQAFARVFRGLGQVLHLLEDMASTPHTRDDLHPFGDPLEAYASTNYGTVAQLNGLPGVTTNPPAADHPRFTVAVPMGGFDQFSDWWDTEQYTGQATFTFGGAPGLAEYSNFNFFSRDTVFDFADSTHPSHADTNLSVLFPPPANGQVIMPSSTANTTGPGWVDVAKITPASAGIHPLTRLARARNMGIYVDPASSYYGVVLNPPQRVDVSCNNVTVLEEYLGFLLPRAIGYGTGLVNYFFRGQVDIRVLWDESAGEYNLVITNRSGENLGAGTWHLYQDDASGIRTEIGGDFSAYPGTLADGATFTATFSATARDGRYTLVFQGTIGSEIDTAVAARVFDIVRVHIIWDPNSDQDLYMWAPDGSLIAYYNLSNDFGELDNDDIGGTGPENITLKRLTEEGDYVFMINYYRDWWQEQYWDSDLQQCVDNTPPANTPDDVGTTCYNQTDIEVTVKTYHNSSSAVREVTRTMSTPNFGAGVPPRGLPEGQISGSWFVTQVVHVDEDGTVTVQGAP